MSDFMPVPPTYAVSDPQVRAVLEALSHNVQVAIDTFAPKDSVQATTSSQTFGLPTYGQTASTTIVQGDTYTAAQLRDDLKAGAANVLAGALNGSTIMKLGPSGQYVVFQHKDAAILGNSGAYSGSYRTALGITSTGIVGGYNDKATGDWQTTLAIESATGNLTVLGTIKANSVIQTGAYLGSQTVSTVLGNISSANSNAAAALAQVQYKLDAQSVYILGSSFSLKTATYDSGNGIAITNTGIIGVKNGSTTFAVDNNGNATFKGNITGATGTFAGDIVTSGQIWGSGSVSSGLTINTSIGGSSYSIYPSIFGSGETSVSGARAGVFGYAGSSGSTWNVGVVGIGDSNSQSIGVLGSGTLYGGNFLSSAANGAGLVCGSTTGAVGLWISGGSFKWTRSNGSSVNIPAPDGGTDKYLRNDGAWASVSTLGGGTVTRVQGTGSVSGITLSGDVSTDGYLSLGGSLSITNGQVTGALGYTPYNSSNPSGYITSSALSSYATLSTTSLSNYSTTSATLAYLASFGNTFYASCSFPGVGYSVSGSGTNSVTYTIFQSSDPSLKRDIQEIDRGLAFVLSLKPKSYYWNSEYFPFAHRSYGFLANEVLAACGGEETSLAYTNTQGPIAGKLAVDYQSMVPVLVKAFQELSAKVDRLENLYARTNHAASGSSPG